ncbi:MAG: hypothetical protein JXR96_09750 [Deltaproteobacteria bacterium]|nr:hypothetical protein [Deltaproteobacteria bacterium]
MKAAHEELARLDYEPVRVERGYAGQTLYVNLSSNEIRIKPVTDYMKEIFTGGKGFDLYLMWHAIDGPIAWDDPRNEICISCGPLGGTPAYSGTSKSIVTGISPTTGSVMDSNVGGHYGPLLKFAGFDAIEIQGKAADEVIVVVDGKLHRVTIELAPHEAVNSYDLAEQIHHMYADTPAELQAISVISAGRGAEHTLIGCLNCSFFDQRRSLPRLKQAGRGGLGTVFRNKKIKALVVRALHNRPRWTIAQAPGEDRA